MNRYAKDLAASLLASTAQVALAAGSPGVERQTEGFLNALAAGSGKPLEQLSTADARAALVSLQAGASLQSLKVDITEKTINAAGHDIKLTVVRPAGAGGTLPVFMFFHGGGWVLGDFPTHERFVRDLVVGSGAAAVFVNYTPVRPSGIVVAIWAAKPWI
jgi:acetyl esterase